VRFWFRKTAWWWKKSAANQSQRFSTLIFLQFCRVEGAEAGTGPICLNKLASYDDLGFNRKFTKTGSEQVAIRRGTRSKLVGISNDTGRAFRMAANIRNFAA